MSINEINIKIETLKEWEAIAAEASAMVESIKDEIKRHMDAQGLEELEAGTHILHTSIFRKGYSIYGHIRKTNIETFWIRKALFVCGL